MGHGNPPQDDIALRKYGTRLLTMMQAVSAPTYLDHELISAIQFQPQQAVKNTSPSALLDIDAFFPLFANHFGFNVFVIDDVRNLSPVLFILFFIAFLFLNNFFFLFLGALFFFCLLFWFLQCVVCVCVFLFFFFLCCFVLTHHKMHFKYKTTHGT